MCCNLTHSVCVHSVVVMVGLCWQSPVNLVYVPEIRPRSAQPTSVQISLFFIFLRHYVLLISSKTKTYKAKPLLSPVTTLHLAIVCASVWQILWQGINSPRNPHVTGFICTAHFFVSVGCCLSKQSGGDVMIGQPGPTSDSHHFINRLQIIVMCHPFIVPGPCITNKHLC